MNKKRKFKKDWFKKWGKVLSGVVGVTGLLVLVRTTGALQAFEWSMYDWFFQIRPLEPIDRRIVIVGLEETDIQKLKEWPVSDGNLARLITKINAQKPRIIGLDIYRDIPVEPGHEELKKVFQTAPIIGVELVSKDESKRVKPPHELKEKGQVGASNLVIDSDGVMRRALLVPIEAKEGEPTVYNIGATLAILYLQQQGLLPHNSTSSFWKDRLAMQIGEVAFYPLRRNDGSYQNAKTGDYQFLLNFRNPKQSFQKVSFSDVLSGKIKPDLFQDKIVLIGSTAPSLKDEFYTPFRNSTTEPNRRLHGVEIQAQIAGHIVSAVLDGRPIIKVIPNWIVESLLEYSLILGCGVLTAWLIWQQRSTENYLILFLKIVGFVLVIVGLLMIGSYFAFLEGWWISIVPSLIEVGGVTLLTIGLILNYKNEELEKLNQKLEVANQELKDTQEQVIFERKQATLSSLVAGVAHEIQNPFHYIINSADLILEENKKFLQKLQDSSNFLPISIIEDFNQTIESIQINAEEISENSERADEIIRTLLLTAQKDENFITTLEDIDNLIDKILNLVTHSKQVENQDFCLNIETSYDPKIGDKEIVVTSFNQILINLLNNACDAVFEKKRKIGEEFQPKIVVTTQLLDDNSIEITVQDNGEGISPKIAEVIYEPFQTTKPTGKGTGLGLFMTYDLVMRSRGQIQWVREGDMTNFIVRLPTSNHFVDDSDE